MTNYKWTLYFKCGPNDPHSRDQSFWFLMRGNYSSERRARQAMINLFQFNNYDGCREATHGKIIHPNGVESIFINDYLIK